MVSINSQNSGVCIWDIKDEPVFKMDIRVSNEIKKNLSEDNKWT